MNNLKYNNKYYTHRCHRKKFCGIFISSYCIHNHRKKNQMVPNETKKCITKNVFFFKARFFFSMYTTFAN